MTGSAPTSGRAPRQTGKVAWFNNDKGWGFLTPDTHPEGDKDVFVHFSGIKPSNGRKRRTLQDGDRVEFEVVTVNAKPQAVNVVVTASAPVEEAAVS